MVKSFGLRPSASSYYENILSLWLREANGTRYTNASDMLNWCNSEKNIYACTKHTSHALTAYAYRLETQEDTTDEVTEQSQQKVPYAIDVDRTGDGWSYGVLMTDGDGTVTVTSMGYMCVKVHLWVICPFCDIMIIVVIIFCYMSSHQYACILFRSLCLCLSISCWLTFACCVCFWFRVGMSTITQPTCLSLPESINMTPIRIILVGVIPLAIIWIFWGIRSFSSMKYLANDSF